MAPHYIGNGNLILTEEDKENAWVTLHEFINDQDNSYGRERIDWLLALLEHAKGSEIQ